MGDFYDAMGIEGGLLYDDVYGGWFDDHRTNKRNGNRERRAREKRLDTFGDNFGNDNDGFGDEDDFGGDGFDDEDDSPESPDLDDGPAAYRRIREVRIVRKTTPKSTQTKKRPKAATEKAPAKETPFENEAELRSALDRLRTEEAARVASLSNLERALEIKTDLGKRYLDLKRQRSSHSGSRLTAINRKLAELSRKTEQPEFDYQGVSTILDVAAERIERMLQEDERGALERFCTPGEIRTFAKRSCHQAVRTAANKREAACLEAIGKREAQEAAARKAKRAADSEQERKHVERNATMLKADTVERILALQRKEAARIANLTLRERAAECGSGIGKEARALASRLEKLRRREQTLTALEQTTYSPTRKRADEIKRELPRLRDRSSDLSARAKAASDELSALQGKMLLKKKKRQSELRTEIGDLEAQKRSCTRTISQLESEQSRCAATLQLGEENREELRAVQHEMRAAKAKLKTLDDALAADAGSFTIENIFSGLTSAFETAFEEDCVKAMRAYRDDAHIRQMARERFA